MNIKDFFAENNIFTLDERELNQQNEDFEEMNTENKEEFLKEILKMTEELNKQEVVSGNYFSNTFLFKNKSGKIFISEIYDLEDTSCSEENIVVRGHEIVFVYNLFNDTFFWY